VARRVVSYDSVSSVRLHCRSGIKDSCHGVVGLMLSGLRQQRYMGASHNIQRARDASCTGQRSPVAATVRATEVESGRVGSGRVACRRSYHTSCRHPRTLLCHWPATPPTDTLAATPCFRLLVNLYTVFQHAAVISLVPHSKTNRF